MCLLMIVVRVSTRFAVLATLEVAQVDGVPAWTLIPGKIKTNHLSSLTKSQ